MAENPSFCLFVNCYEYILSALSFQDTRAAEIELEVLAAVARAAAANFSATLDVARQLRNETQALEDDVARISLEDINSKYGVHFNVGHVLRLCLMATITMVTPLF